METDLVLALKRELHISESYHQANGKKRCPILCLVTNAVSVRNIVASVAVYFNPCPKTGWSLNAALERRCAAKVLEVLYILLAATNLRRPMRCNEHNILRKLQVRQYCGYKRKIIWTMYISQQ